MRMITALLATLAVVLSALFAPVMAGPTAPNAKTYESGITYAEFLAANGCTLVDMGGYSNAKGPDGGACLAPVDWARSGGGYLTDTDSDGDLDWVGSDY